MSRILPCLRNCLLLSTACLVGCGGDIRVDQNREKSSSIHSPSLAQTTIAPDTMKTRKIEFEFSELNWSLVDVSPDGKTLLFDSLGDLYTLPIEGGEATLLRGGFSWDVQARYSPDGSRITFSSNQGKNGAFGVRVMPAKGGKAELVNSDPYHRLNLEWASDGKSILNMQQSVSYAGGRLPNQAELPGGVNDLKLIFDTPSFQNRTKLIKDGFKADFYSMAHGGRYIYYASGREVKRYDTITGDVKKINIPLSVGEPIYYDGDWSGISETPTDQAEYPEAEQLLLLRVSPNESFLIYLIEKEEGLTLRHYDLETQKVRNILGPKETTDLFDIEYRRQSIRTGGTMIATAGLTITPDSREVITVAGGHIVRIDIATGAVRPVPFKAKFSQVMPDIVRTTIPFEQGPVRIKNVRWPSVSNDYRLSSFGAHGKVWLHDTKTNETRRVTAGDGLEFAPAISPDGLHITYIDWKDDGTGKVMIVGTKQDSKPIALVEAGGFYMNPTWSLDGTKIAYLRAPRPDNGEERFDKEKRSLELVEVDNGEVSTLIEEFEFLGGFNERENTPLSFSSDGDNIYWMDFESIDDKAKTGIWINSINIKTRKRQSHFSIGDGYTYQHVIVSPDEKNVAIIHSTGIWSIPVGVFATAEVDGYQIDGKTHYKLVPDLSLLPEAKHITNRAATYVIWNGNNELVWSAANTIYKTDKRSVSHPQTAVLPSKVVAEIQIVRPRVKAKGVIAYTDVRILTMGPKGEIENGTILVKDNKIIAIDGANSVKIPVQAKVLSLAGKTIMPGMIDTHAHPTNSSVEFFKQQNPNLTSNLAFGVTTLFEVSGAAVSHLTQGEMTETGDVIGPRGLGVGGGVFGIEFDFDDIDTMHQLIKDKKAMGAWGLKSYGIGIQVVRRALIEAARIEGLNVVAHYDDNFPWTPLLFAAEGTTALEHSPLVSPVAEDWIKFFAATGIHFTSTTPAEKKGISGLYFTSKYNENSKVNRYLERSAKEETMNQSVREIRDAILETPLVKTFYRGLLNVLRAGGHVSMGLHGELNGPDAHLVLESLVLNGFTPLEAISTLTSEPAHKLGLENHLGSLQAGYMADFIILNANPLDDIKNSMDIKYIVKNGFVYDDESMTQLWPEYVTYEGPFGGDVENFKPQVPKPLVFETP